MKNLTNVTYIFNECLAESEFITTTGLTIYYLNDKRYDLLVNTLKEIKEYDKDLEKYINIAKNITKRIKENRKNFTKDQIDNLEKIEYPFSKEIEELDNLE